MKTNYIEYLEKNYNLIRHSEEIATVDCGICGENINLGDMVFSLDHLIPASRGGTDTPENMSVTHPECNQVKSDLTLEELVEKMKLIISYQESRL
jgi:5-methylcytosine-specific restriction endonuclease McrA